MTLDAALRELMTDTVTIAPVSTRDAYGKHGWATAVSYVGRIQSGDHKVLDPKGVERVSVGRVYIPDAPDVSIHDKLTLPDGTSPPILAIDETHDERGTHHTTIHYGKENA